MFKEKDFVVSGVIVFVKDNTETLKLPCKINMLTLEVFDFDMSKVFTNIKLLNQEYLIINDVIESVYGVSNDLRSECDFWYNDM